MPDQETVIRVKDGVISVTSEYTFDINDDEKIANLVNRIGETSITPTGPEFLQESV